MSVRLYVGNLPAELDSQALEQIFHESGESVSLKVITDRKTGKCRGFGFVTVETSDVANAVIEKFNGFDFNGAVLKLEVALPRNGKSEENEQSEAAEATPAPARNVPKPALRSARFDIQTDVAVSTEDRPARKANAKRSERRNKSRKQNSQRTAAALSYADTPEAHQPDPRWAQELAQLRQRLLDAQAVK